MPPKAKPCCKDCNSTTRALKYPGPRCATCWRAVSAERKDAAHGSYVERTYGIAAAEYDLLYAAQGGRCAICRRATGKARRLAVDHDHKTGEVRGLLCKPCNRYGIGMFARDNAELLDRAADYLRNPPARKVLIRFQDPSSVEETCRDQQAIVSSQTLPQT